MDFVARRHPLAVPSNDMLLEAFVGGTEHNVELFLDDWSPVFELVSDKLPMKGPYFVKTGHVMPSRQPSGDVDRIRAAARAAAAAVGIKWGWAHAEIKLCDGIAHVIEIAARPGGGYTREIVRLAYNIDMRKILIEAHLGSLPAQPPSAENVVFGRNIVSEGIEWFFSIAGLTAARKSGGSWKCGIISKACRVFSSGHPCHSTARSCPILFSILRPKKRRKFSSGLMP